MHTKQTTSLDLFTLNPSETLLLPYADQGIQAGFASPAQDYLEQIDLIKELIKNPSSTFLGRIRGISMLDANLHDGDIVVIDKSLPYKEGCKAVCCIEGDFTIKFIQIKGGEIWLVPANPQFPTIKVTNPDEFLIWGIVIYTIRKEY